jgi:HPt (histidine-containing phosphotransfer) domain-containing protein
LVDVIVGLALVASAGAGAFVFRRARRPLPEGTPVVEEMTIAPRLVATVGHELRTPLGGIIGMTELLEQTPLDAHQRMLAQAIRVASDNLLRIVNELLDFSRADAGRVQLDEVAFDLPATLNDVVVIAREHGRARGIEVRLTVDPALPHAIAGDPFRLKHVLDNLVGNAVRFTDEGSVHIDVAPEGSLEGTPMIRFAVHDTGIGIEAAALERIFNPFTHADAAIARRYGSSGLGLTIARQLAQVMGGRIAVQSVAGVGSTFTLTLPLRAPALAAAPPPRVGSAARTRLRTIFGGDDGRVDEVITMAIGSLRDGVAAIVAAIDQHERSELARTAHRLKGVALEIGFSTVAESAMSLERAAKDDAWEIVLSSYRALADAIEREAGLATLVDCG